MIKSIAFITCFSFLLMSTTDVSKQELLGKVDPSKHENFELIHSEYTKKEGIYMRKEVYTQFKKMFWEAEKCGIKLEIVSAMRNFNYQKGIWERKWKREKYANMTPLEKVRDILKYSAMPGTSRHHWGTDLDFNALTNSYFEKGEGKKVYDWLTTHGSNYGFHQTYTCKEHGRKGYEEEKWHWTYLPLSEKFISEYKNSIQYSDLTGFSGSEYAKEVKAIEHYVMGIEQELIKE